MIRAAPLLALLATPALAQGVPCDEHWGGSLALVAEPLEETSRAYANGDVRLFVLASPEPACCGVFVAAVFPDPDGAFRLCRVLTGPGDAGWGGARFVGEASYDPARGLLVPMELSTWDGEAYDRTMVRIQVNRATGDVMVAP